MGDVVTGVLLKNTAAAAAANPTTARFGIANAAGVMLAIGPNANAAASWGLGVINFPFTAPFTIVTAGGYFAAFVVDGIWGTPPALASRSSNANLGLAFGANAPETFAWAAQTDLPSVSWPLTLTTGDAAPFWMAFY